MAQTQDIPAAAASALSTRQLAGLVLGPILFALLLFVGPSEGAMATLGDQAGRHAWVVLALLALMAIWWVTEAIPIPVTSLLPIIVLPLGGVQSVKETSAEYLHPIVVLLLGGFIVAKVIERWNLHARIALSVVASVGARPTMLVAGFMLAAALLSMWISNTATAIMLTPIALSVAAAAGADRMPGLSLALLLGVAWACSIGGLGTPVGTPTNLIVMGYLEDEAGVSISFGQWMTIGLPTVLVLLPMAWFVLTRWVAKLPSSHASGAEDVVKEELARLGPISTPEARALGVFLIVASLWIFRDPLRELSIGGIAPLAGLTDHITAMIGVVLCFLIPSGSRSEKGTMLLDWETAETIPWGVVLLFGGGMALAAAIRGSGLGVYLGGELEGMASLPLFLLVLLLTTFVIFTTEVTSNVATASALMPVLAAMAAATGIDVASLALPLALAASCAFMLPMATGPNAVVYASGRVSLPEMARAGVRLNLLAIPMITVMSLTLAPVLFGR